MTTRQRAAFLLLAAVLLILTGCAKQDSTYYAVEMDGTLVGYTEVKVTPGDSAPETAVHREAETRIRFSLLGEGVDLHFLERMDRDQATGRIIFYDADITTGDMKMGATATIRGARVDYRPRGGGKNKQLEVDDDVIFTDNMTFPYVRDDFVAGDRDSAAYRVFDWVTAEIHEVSVRRVGRDTLVAADLAHDCLVFNLHNRANGMTGRFWIDRTSSDLIRAERGDGVVTYLADAGIRRRVKRLDIDKVIFIDVDEDIQNVQGISYMRVRARIRVPGRPFSAESLTRAGQTFEGTVESGVVDGVFTIEHRRFDGHGAPPFPSKLDGREDLRRYLEPEMTIESDDPVLVAKAQELTAGAVDSWIAAGLLSRWVGDEVGYDIPGGSARQTFDSRAGECGAHSRLLVAFCRAVGIPARMVMGCMYAQMRGPIFGQHAWVEVYMGEAGWIPVDATVQEYDYIDSGHIRLGELVGFHPQEMEILDYRVTDSAEAAAGVTAGVTDGEIDWTENRLVDVGGFRLHMRRAGTGSPTVLVEPGFGSAAETWEPILAELVSHSRVVLYDRAGYEQSEPGPLPRTLRGTTGELAALLENGGVPGPFVIVGHSLGGLLAQVFAVDHPDRVAGLVLLDPAPLPFVLGDRFAELREMADGLTHDLERQGAAAEEAGDEYEAARLRGLAAEHEMLFGGSDEELRTLGDLGDIPLVVIASGVPNPSFGEVAESFQEFWIEENRRLATRSTRGRFLLAAESTHALNQDAPETVVAAIREVLKLAVE